MKSAFPRFRAALPAVLAFLTAAAVSALAEITLHQDFDSGALLVDESFVEGDWVYLEGPDNFNSGRWKWIHFRADGVGDRELYFQIGDNFASGSSRLGTKEMVYREEGGDWEFFDNHVWDSNAGTYTFYNDAPFSAGTVWVAYSFPYPFQRVVDHVEAVRGSPWVLPTASSGENLVIGGSPGGVDDRGRTVPPLPLFGYRITDPESGVADKERIVLCSGVHANEVLAGYVLEGLVDWLIGDDPRAAALRREVEFFVYPMVNPDGRYAGYNRGGVQHPGRDTNRFWREDLYDDMDDIRQIAEAMKTDTGSERVSWVLDFHSWTNTLDHFVIMNPPGDETVFWEELTRMEPDMGLNLGHPGSANPTTRWFALNRLNAEYGVIPETMFRPGEYPERYLAMGRRFGIAFFHEVDPELDIEPAAEILMLLEAGHSDEAAVRALGAWIESERFGEYAVTYSADLDIDVLDSAASLSPAQREILEGYDLILMPRRGVGGSGEFASTDWNTITTPLLNMNPFTYRDGNWRWVPAGTETVTSPAIREMAVVDGTSPFFRGVDTGGGTVTIYHSPNSTMQVEVDASVFTGRVAGWTDRVDGDGEYLEYPWLVVWDGTEPAFYEGGAEAPAGRRTLFLGQFPADPHAYTAEGRRILLNAVAHTAGRLAPDFDAWTARHFTEAQRNDPEIGGPYGDPSGDGVVNLLNYVLGGDPWLPERPRLPVPEIESIEVDGETAEYLRLPVTRIDNLPGVSLSVKAGGDPETTEGKAVLAEVRDNGDGTVTEIYRDVIPVAEATRRFLRLHVELVEEP